MKKNRSILFACVLCWAVIAVLGATPADAKPGKPGGGSKVCLCHVPPGNPADAHTICVGFPAVRAHLGHGDSLGECPVICGGDAGDTCTDDQFCRRDEGECSSDARGVCTPLPVDCPTTPAPVCGCDGTTYDNACLASAAGVTVQHAGACQTETVCGGTAGDTCDADQFCKRDQGACADDDEGICTRLPVTCPVTLAPVCGCDGTTYSNSCFADVADVTVQHDGPCEAGAACGGEAEDCPEGEFCKPPIGECAEDAAGSCVAMDATCSQVDQPVCGCDGITYGNPCLADNAGIAIDHAGACGADVHQCGGEQGATCTSGEFCKRPEGACETDAAGLCTDIPANCPAFLDPVCGCDGVNYSSPCVADGAGIAVANHGLCEPPRACGGETGEECRSDEFCKPPVGSCTAGAEGTCAGKPLLCPVAKNEVCGCDGQTYDNSCRADAAGVAIDHTGACVPVP